jgi:hypothetical protein
MFTQSARSSTKPSADRDESSARPHALLPKLIPWYCRSYFLYFYGSLYILRPPHYIQPAYMLQVGYVRRCSVRQWVRRPRNPDPIVVLQSLSLLFSYSRRLLHRRKNSDAMNVTSHLHALPRLRMSGAVPPCAFVVWGVANHRNRIIHTFYWVHFSRFL